jgi:hypothetical protein
MSGKKTNETKKPTETGAARADGTAHQQAIPLLPENTMADIIESHIKKVWINKLRSRYRI